MEPIRYIEPLLFGHPGKNVDRHKRFFVFAKAMSLAIMSLSIRFTIVGAGKGIPLVPYV